MVVLEGDRMLLGTNNQYLQSDYLSSLPTTLDAKNSPLALLAQTCSQIGADTTTPKQLNSPTEKTKKSPAVDSVSPSSDKTKNNLHGVITVENKLPFKPYETNVVVKKTDVHRVTCSVQNFEEGKTVDRCSSVGQASSPMTRSIISPNNESRKYLLEQNSSPTKNASPSIRQGNEDFQEYCKDTQTSTDIINSNNDNRSPSCCSSGLEQSNPAFRSSFSGAPFNFHQQSALYSSGYTNTSSGQYSSYIRVKTPSGGEALVPVCKDPYCTGCQYNLHNQQILLNNVPGCPSGCNQCDHQKYNLAAAMSFGSGAIPPSLTYTPLVKPYICNWISSDSYCGKRFVTSEELLQHLRSHTSGVDTVSVGTSPTALLNPLLFASSSLHRHNYLHSINPISSVRYHPYNKAAIQSLIGSSYSAFSPTVFGPYYSPYSVYNQRVNATAVHP